MATTQPDHPQTNAASRRMLFWSALATSVLAFAAFGIAATTPPRTGPFAATGTALAYPYADAVKFVPGDFVWMYPVMLMVLAYLFTCVCLRERASGNARTWATLGLALAVTGFTALGIDYFVQIYTVQPALLAGEAADVVALSQYNPHGFFIAAENFGYLAMALSLGVFAPTLGGNRTGLAARWIFAAAALLGVFALVAMSFAFGLGIEYRLEVALITIVYLALMLGGLMVTLSTRRSAARPA